MAQPINPIIFILEDDPDIAGLLKHHLQTAGYGVSWFPTSAGLLDEMHARRPALVILDIMVPGNSGLDIAKAIRSNSALAAIPIVFVTARTAESDRLRGFEIGADDYITKPFSPNEVVARVRALLRRAHRAAPADSRLSYGTLSVDLDRHVVKVDDVEVKLTAKEFLLLQYLMEHRGRVLSRDLLLSDVWSYSYTGGTRTVDVHVRRLREKVPMLADAIVTVKQFGYKLLDPAPA